MRGLSLFAAGLVLGALAVLPGAAQDAGGGSSDIKLNHVGITVKSIEETLNFYKSIGVREAFTLRDANGNATMAYLQISRETFMEVAQATADRPLGLSHFGIEAADVKASVQRLRATGVKVEDIRVSRTNTLLASAIDPNGVRFELAELPADSLPRKAMDAWR